MNKSGAVSTALEAPTTATSDAAAVHVSAISKSYQIYDKPQHRLWQGLFRGRRQFFREFWALREVSFSIQPSEVVGVIGRNGSGKSTLLQVISGIVTPTMGTVVCRGRVAALLELGAGFSPEFSGIDNVYLNGRVLGISRPEIDARLSDILAFADIGSFVYQPVKTYSTGMYMRLAFAVAACVEPDVLIVDEALAVGDVQFQAKCFRRFDELIGRGTTILFVTHSTEQVVRHCSRAILLDGGRVVYDGAPRTAVNQYLDLALGAQPREVEGPRSPSVPGSASVNVSSVASLTQRFEDREGYSRAEYRWGNGDARIVDFAVTSDDDVSHHVHVKTGDLVKVAMRVTFSTACQRPIFGLFIKTPDGVTVFGNNTRDALPEPLHHPVVAGACVDVVMHMRLALGAGHYLLSMGVAADNQGEIVPLDRRYDAVQLYVSNRRSSLGLAELEMSYTVVTV